MDAEWKIINKVAEVTGTSTMCCWCSVARCGDVLLQNAVEATSKDGLLRTLTEVSFVLYLRFQATWNSRLKFKVFFPSVSFTTSVSNGNVLKIDK